jgi:hypothetical protein
MLKFIIPLLLWEKLVLMVLKKNRLNELLAFNNLSGKH